MLHWLGSFVPKGGSNNTGGDGDDRITQQHHHRREEFPRRGHRRHVAKAHSGHRHDGIINRSAQIRELCVRCISLHDVHQCADAGNQDEDKEKIDQNLVETPAQRFQEKITFIEKTEQAEHTKHANEPDGAKQKHIARSWEDERQIRWSGRDETDDAEEAERIFSPRWRAIESCHVVEGEDYGKEVFQHFECHLKGMCE